MALLPFTVRVYLCRQWLYIALVLFSGTLVGLTAARLHYTTHLPPGDPLNNGHSFYDHIVAELFAAAALTFFWAIHMVHTIARSVERGGFLVRIFFELLVLGFFWVLYIVGAAYSTHLWKDLSFCWQYQACRILTALVAFAWIGWITISALFLTTFVYAFTCRGWTRYSHGRWREILVADKEGYRT